MCLFNSLVKAQKEFIKLHNVDITSVVSISSLAMKIFRINYLEVDIPILNINEDNFIRKGYYGVLQIQIIIKLILKTYITMM